MKQGPVADDGRERPGDLFENAVTLLRKSFSCWGCKKYLARGNRLHGL